jgi:hypothetical protein
MGTDVLLVGVDCQSSEMVSLFPGWAGHGFKPDGSAGR